MSTAKCSVRISKICGGDITLEKRQADIEKWWEENQANIVVIKDHFSVKLLSAWHKHTWPFVYISNQIRYMFQRRKHGFDGRDLYNLNTTIAEFILPRLKMYRKNVEKFGSVPAVFWDEENDYASSQARWLEALDKMIYVFERYEKCDEKELSYWYLTKEEREVEDAKLSEGRCLFAEYFDCLWL